MDTSNAPSYTPAQVDTLSVLIKTATQGGLIPPDAAKGMVRALRTGMSGRLPAQEPERLLTTAQVGELLALSRKSVLRMAKARSLPCIHIRPGVAKSLRYRFSDVTALMSAAPTQEG
jgi:predicted DNA-binding transcriptional regulator AlpA